MKHLGLKNRSRRRGSTLVELSLVLMIMVWILVGTVDIAQVIYFHHNLVYRARKAAHFGATTSWNETEVKNVVIYGNPEGTGNPFYGLDGANVVSAQLLDAGTSSARVKVSSQNYPYRFFTPGVAGAYTARPIVVSMTHEDSLDEL